MASEIQDGHGSSLPLGETAEDPPSGNFLARSSNTSPPQPTITSSGDDDEMEQLSTISNTQLPEEICIAEDRQRSALLEAKEQRKLPLRCLIVVGLLVITLLIGLIVALAVALAAPGTSPRAPSTPEPTTTLGRVAQRGSLRCGICEVPGFAQMNLETGLYEGFDVDLVSSAEFAFVVVVVVNFLKPHAHFSAVPSPPLFSERTTMWNI